MAEEYPMPCETCEPCADQKQPCLRLIDVDGEGGSTNSGIDISGLTTKREFVAAIKHHNKKMGRKTPTAPPKDDL